MKKILFGLRHYARHLVQLWAVLALLFVPLALSISLWVTKSTETHLSELCETRLAQNRITLENFVSQIRSTFRHAISENLPPPINETILATAVFRKSAKGWKLAVTDFNRERLSLLGLTLGELASTQLPAPSSVRYGDEIAIGSRQVGRTTLWTLEFQVRSVTEVYAVAVQVYPEPLLKGLAQDTSCAITYFGTDGSLLASVENFDSSKMARFLDVLRGQLKSPLSLNEMSRGSSDNLEIRTDRTQSGMWISSVFDSTVAQMMGTRWFNSIVFLGLMIGFLLTAILLPIWYSEMAHSKTLEDSIDRISTGHFDSRPRLFLENHLSQVEGAIDRLGTRMAEYGELIGLWKRSGLTQDLDEFHRQVQSQHQETLTLLTISLPRITDLVDSDKDAVSLYNQLCDRFQEIIKRNQGIVDLMTPEKLQGYWPYSPQKPEDIAFAVMAALEFKLEIEDLNIKQHFKSLLVLGQAVHHGGALLSLSGSTGSHHFGAWGELATENYEIARYAHATQQEVLITGQVANQVSPYFVVSPAQQSEHSNINQRLFRVIGYVDREENPVLIKSRIS